MHIYKLDDIEYPSVTTVLSIVTKDDALMKWANHMGFRHKDIEDIKKEVTTFGTLVHSHLQQEVDSNFFDAIPYKDTLEQYEVEGIVSKFKAYFKDIPYHTIATEKTIISKELGYAGTLDWLADMSQHIFLNDFKTSKKPHETMFLQLGGYSNLLKTIGIEPDYASIITANSKGVCMYPIDKQQLQYYGSIFNLLYSFYKEFMMRMKITPDYNIMKLIKTSC